MTIEFHCPHCDKLLKTADDKAGVQANCPGCGEAVIVPTAAESNAQFDESFSNPAGDPAYAGPPSRPPENPMAASSAAAETTKACPMCGERIMAAATVCRFCGETLPSRKALGIPTHIDAGEAVSTAWEIYKANVGILAAATLIMGAIWFALYIAAQVVQGGIMISMMAARGGQMPANDPQLDVLAAVYGCAFGFGMLNFAVVSCFLQAGYHRLLLMLARGENAEIGVLFSGGRIFWRIFWANFLFTLMYVVGLVFLIIPGVFVLLLFWPFMFVIIDRDAGVFESFQQSNELTSGNYLAGVLLGLIAIGASFAGLMTCGIGMLFTYPFAILALAVAYCRMSGQQTCEMRRV